MSGKTVTAEPLKMVRPIRSPCNPLAMAAKRCRMSASNFDIEPDTSRHSITSRLRDCGVLRVLADRPHRQTGGGEGDDAEGGELGSDEHEVAAPDAPEHLGVGDPVDVGDAGARSEAAVPSPHGEGDAGGEGDQRRGHAERAGPRLHEHDRRHHCTTTARAASTATLGRPAVRAWNRGG